MRILLFTAFALGACSGSDDTSTTDTDTTPGTTDTPTDPTEPTEPTEPTDTTTPTDTGTYSTPATTTEALPALTEGHYAPTFLIENDTCGGLTPGLDLSPIEYDLEGDTTTQFDLVDHAYGTPTIVCEVDASNAVTCTGYDQDVPYTYNGVFQFHSDIAAFEATSPTSFQMIEHLTANCAGSDCKSLAKLFTVTFPCTLDMLETFAQ